MLSFFSWASCKMITEVWCMQRHTEIHTHKHLREVWELERSRWQELNVCSHSLCLYVAESDRYRTEQQAVRYQSRASTTTSMPVDMQTCWCVTCPGLKTCATVQKSSQSSCLIACKQANFVIFFNLVNDFDVTLSVVSSHYSKNHRASQTSTSSVNKIEV